MNQAIVSFCNAATETQKYQTTLATIFDIAEYVSHEKV